MPQETRTTLATHGCETPVRAGTMMTIVTDRREQNFAGVYRLLRDVSQDQIEDLVRNVREGSAAGDRNRRVINRMLDAGMIERVHTCGLVIDVSSPRPCLLMP